MLVVRVDSGGVPDPTFGTGGVVSLPAGSQAIAQAIAIQPSDDKIVVAGGVVIDQDTLEYDFRLARLLPADGQLDSGFGTGGIVQSPARSTQPGVNALALQADGKIVAAGEGKPDPTRPNRDFLITRYLSDGTPDAAFGTSGSSFVSMGKRLDAARGLALQSDGAIVAAGYSTTPNRANAVVARLTSDGALDASYRHGGRRKVRLGKGLNYAVDVQVISGDQALIGGVFTSKHDPIPHGKVAVGQLTTSGDLDDTFGNRGVGSAGPDPDTTYHVSRIAVQNDGKIVAVGDVSPAVNTTFDVLIARFNADGTLDSSFGDGGIVDSAFGDQDEAFGVALDASGNIVVVGVSYAAGQSRVLIARYLP
jgi:uncharacterized delta-60 repeat protein